MSSTLIVPTLTEVAWLLAAIAITTWLAAMRPFPAPCASDRARNGAFVRGRLARGGQCGDCPRR